MMGKPCKTKIKFWLICKRTLKKKYKSYLPHGLININSNHKTKNIRIAGIDI